MKRLFFLTAAFILAGTAIAKGLTAFSDAGVFDTYEPLFGLSFRALFAVAAILECITAVVCVAPIENAYKAGTLLISTCAIALYRLGLTAMGYQKGCPCLGQFTDVLKIDSSTAEAFLYISLAVMIIGSGLIGLQEARAEPNKHLS